MTTYPTARGLAGVLRRFGAGCYDGLLVGGLLMLAIGLATWATRAAGIAGVLSAYPYRPQYQLIALGVIYAYFAASWLRSGETLGMKAWGLRLVGAGDRRVGAARIALRLLLAIPLWLMPVASLLLYMGHRAPWWAATLCGVPLAVSMCCAYPAGVSLHDRLSGTRILRVPRDAPVKAGG